MGAGGFPMLQRIRRPHLHGDMIGQWWRAPVVIEVIFTIIFNQGRYNIVPMRLNLISNMVHKIREKNSFTDTGCHSGDQLRRYEWGPITLLPTVKKQIFVLLLKLLPSSISFPSFLPSCLPADLIPHKIWVSYRRKRTLFMPWSWWLPTSVFQYLE